MLSLAIMLAAGLACGCGTRGALPTTPPPSAGPSAAPVAGAVGARVVNQSARWTGLLAGDELKDEAETMFVISGEVENTGPEPITWVKHEYELLADSSDGEVVLASEYGYNFRAEALRSAAVEAGDIAPTAVPIQALAPGEKDLFRMVFFRADVPRFDRWRVRILEVR